MPSPKTESSNEYTETPNPIKENIFPEIYLTQSQAVAWIDFFLFFWDINYIMPVCGSVHGVQTPDLTAIKSRIAAPELEITVTL